MNAFIEFFNKGDAVNLLIKLFGIVGGFLYFFFAWVMIGQIRALKKTIEVHDEGLLITLAYVQLILSAVIVLYALFIL
ncbi:hypothetical protein A3I56_02895 [Candidatus Roizmanbacteria bacterium RIFCSPLOWO2_02_FULL_43_10]|uniref:Uncharacterized protein n=3 Tax=Candidatus Roizmaniibacteriota TaxID=1752723 RepID=A0A1F7JZT6_9BACT|nr:MAG: hypothetical protein A3D08_03680 [Candidatus Roizmanbacteria bacterium RIFCSPHIGHO2_02_FULL_43_11]OGK38726.1 MAG: hypothetical protein A3F32_02405 [Candidatus Roizmanbacteria bacterium RIFCSPHIGHO2_12_FULL_42_10]OGK61124.1 MAG: hypothetical protein A3I56_02895 [Candidatus Roizmanbacteria bacterium RIFCSPLOWO2_02_FULL_43_10]